MTSSRRFYFGPVEEAAPTGAAELSETLLVEMISPVDLNEEESTSAELVTVNDNAGGAPPTITIPIP